MKSLFKCFMCFLLFGPNGASLLGIDLICVQLRIRHFPFHFFYETFDTNFIKVFLT